MAAAESIASWLALECPPARLQASGGLRPSLPIRFCQGAVKRRPHKEPQPLGQGTTGFRLHQNRVAEFSGDPKRRLARRANDPFGRGEKGLCVSNIQIVQKIYEAFGKGDIPFILSTLHPTVDWEHDTTVQGIPWIVPRHGAEEVGLFFASLAGLDFLHFEPLSFFESGNEVMTTLRIEAIVKATGKKVRDMEAHLFTFDGEGRVVRFRHFVDTDQHRRAATP
jgi:uncharacterized protein